MFNKTVVGQIDRVYTNPIGFRLGGKVYNIEVGDFDPLYLDGSKLEALTDSVLESMMDEEEDVTVFFDFEKNVVLVAGETGDIATSSFYAVVTDDTNMWTSRSGRMWSFDVITEKGEKLALDITEKDLEEEYGFGNVTIEEETVFDWEIKAVAGQLFRVTIDEDGEITNVVWKEATDVATVDLFDIDDTYVGNARLMSNTVVFYDYKDGAPRKAIAFGDVDDEFYDIENAKVLVEEGRVKVVLAIETDADTEATSAIGLVTNVRHLRTGYVEITIEVAGVEKVYTTEGKVAFGTSETDEEIDGLMALKNNFAKVMVGDVSGKLVKFEDVYAKLQPLQGPFEVLSRSTIDRTITVYGRGPLELLSNTIVYLLEDGEYDSYSLRQILGETVSGPVDQVKVIYDGTSMRFVKYVVVEKID